MKDFYEVYKTLISTEMSHQNGAPHIMLTSIGFDTQKNASSVEFDYKKIYDREDTYQDIAGFYHTHPSGLNQMSSTDVMTMTQWVQTLGKSLVCVIETKEGINGWLFYKNEAGGIDHRVVKVATSNDVHYDLWVDPDHTFWNPVDFLTEGEFSDEDDINIFDDMQESINTIVENQSKILEAISILVRK